MAKKRSTPALPSADEYPPGYDEVLAGISELLSRARHSTAQAINSILTASYWEVGRRIIELEQRGHVRAAYGEGLWKRLAADLTARHGRGFSKSNIALMRAFYLQWEIFQTPSGKFVAQAKGSPFSQLPGRSEDEGPDRLNLPQATRLQPVVRRVSPVGLHPVPLSHRSGISKRVMIIVNDPGKRAGPWYDGIGSLIMGM